MTRGQHSLKRLTNLTARTRRIALVTAPVVTVLAVGAGMITTDIVSSSAPSVARPTLSWGATVSSETDLSHRLAPQSRSFDRTRVKEPVLETPVKTLPVKAKLWSTDVLNVYVLASRRSAVEGEIPAGKELGATGRKIGGFVEIIRNRESRWVNADYVSTKKPAPAPTEMGLGGGPCPGTSGVMSGLTSGADRVYEAVCNNFPQIRTYGGYAARGEHSSGRAIDIMTSDVSLGNAIAEFLRAHASELNLYDVIWRQRIYTQERGSEGWRAMSDRGGATANHMDHVHVSVN